MAHTAGRSLLTVEAEAFWPYARPEPARLWLDEDRAWPAGLVEHYVSRYSAPGDLVIDPFAAQPALIRAAAAQRRLLLNHYSPATALAIGVAALPPARSAVDAAFTAVANAPRRGRTLADYLRSLYETVCPQCAQTISADYLVWDRNAGEPVERGYSCPHCGSSGLAPADLADVNLAAGLEVRGAAYWGLLSRLVAPGDPQTEAARRLLELYTPRSLTVISELLAAVEQRLKDPDQRRAGLALVLHVMQRCLSLYQQPLPWETLAPALPAQLHLPARFVEHNAWLAFEAAYRQLAQRPRPAVREVNDLAALTGPYGQGSALILGVSAHNLAKQLPPESVALALSTPPPLSSARYALSFLWTGWLFGRNAAAPLKPMLAMPPPTWDWYVQSLAAALRGVRRALRPDGRLVMAGRSASARPLLALLNAADLAGLRLVAQAVQAPLLADEEEMAWQLTFARRGPRAQGTAPTEALDQARQAAQDAVLDLVHLRGEPIPVTLANAAVAVQWEAGDLLGPLREHPEAARRPIAFQVQQSRAALTPDLPPLGLRYGGGEGIVEQWVPDLLPTLPPLADRVELAVAELLGQDAWTAEGLLAAIYGRFRGWETPDAALVDACLESYAEEQADGRLALRPEDEAARRARERGEMLLRLHTLGHRLGYQVWVAPAEQGSALGLVPLGKGGPDRPEAWAPAGLVWHEAGRPAYAFALTFHAVLHPWLRPPATELADCPRYVVLPGGRAGLVAFKLRRSPAWRGLLAEAGWAFVKFRHVRQLASLSDLTRAGFRARIELDPIVRLPGEQLALFTAAEGA
ncbi:MAG: hypothetical protein NZ528_06595 [Caldilineales bacterium]|nr:hypothetical protein [Caldilineales bacterium]MDW8318722.1 hypothetical protein [Anaerolineae bacterium]